MSDPFPRESFSDFRTAVEDRIRRGDGMTPIRALALYFDSVEERLEKGAVEYGNNADTKPLADLLEEAIEETADIPGWAFWIWRNVPEDKRPKLEAIMVDAFKIWRRLQLFKVDLKRIKERHRQMKVYERLLDMSTARVIPKDEG